MTPILYIHLADDGGILVIESETGRSMWIGLAELERRLNALRASSGSVLLSRETGSRLADPALAIVRRAGVPAVHSPEIHPDAARSGGATTLMSMAYMGAAELVQDLVQRGVELEAADEDGFTALMYAANAGQDQVVELLIRAGADVSHRDREGSTALMLAAQHGFLGIVKKLLVARAATGSRRADGLTAHDFAVGNGHQRVASVITSASSQAR
jgi:Ankyrin repeats (many copies)